MLRRSVLVLALFAPGCALLPARARRSADARLSREDVRAAVERERDPYRKLTTFVGPSVRDASVEFSLERQLSEGGADETVLRVAWSGSSWRFLQSAFDIHGRSLELRVAARDVSADAGVVEHVEVVLPRSILEEPRLGPLELRLFGEKGHVDVELPQAYIEGFLDAAR